MAWKVTAIIILCLAIYIAYQLVDRFDPDTVRGKNIVITGSSTGIGEQMAYHYARLGANVLITARREERLQQVIEKCKEIGQENGKYFYIPLDMMDVDAPLKLVKYAENILGRIDYVVLNHVISWHFGEWMGSKENFTRLDRTFTVSFNSYVSIASYFTPHLEASNGSLIVMSSAAGKMPIPFFAPYSAAKHALQVHLHMYV